MWKIPYVLRAASMCSSLRPPIASASEGNHSIMAFGRTLRIPWVILVEHLILHGGGVMTHFTCCQSQACGKTFSADSPSWTQLESTTGTFRSKISTAAVARFITMHLPRHIWATPVGADVKTDAGVECKPMDFRFWMIRALLSSNNDIHTYITEDFRMLSAFYGPQKTLRACAHIKQERNSGPPLDQPHQWTIITLAAISSRRIYSLSLNSDSRTTWFWGVDLRTL